MKKSALLRIVLCVPIALLASCVSPSPNSTEASLPVEITSFPHTLKTDTIHAEFSGYEVHDHSLWITTCFESPSEGDWFFGDISLKIDGQELQNSGISRDPAPGRADGFECETIIFDKDDQIIPAGNAELTVGRLELFTPVEEWDCRIAQKHLDEAKTGIVVKCNIPVAGAITVTKKPAFMSDEEALLKASNALSYSEAIPLDWKFSFLIEQP